ncbi:MAG: hypothetical protein KDD84_24655 [Caldilineaceae bacterium]|nr:hypothetical protein [Caldilineaceae bacterium]
MKDANNQLDQSRGFVELPNLAYLACDATLPNMQFEAIVRDELACFRDRQPDVFYYYLAEIEAVHARFLGEAPQRVDETNLCAVMHQATVCKVWLDFLQGQDDYETGRGVDAGLIYLWRRYFRTLAAVHEAANRESDGPGSDLFRQWCNLDDEYRRALRNWWRILADPANEWFFIHLRDRGAPGQSVARVWEGEVDALLRTQDGHLRPFFRNAGDVARSFLDRVARVWYLPRMDLVASTKIVRDLLPAQGGGQVLRLLYASGLPWLGVGVIALLFVAAGFLPTPLTVPYAYGVHTIALGFGLGWMALILMLVGGLGYLIVWLRLGRLGVYPFSLRVAAGTVVGLIAIPGLSDNVAQFLFAPMAQTGGAAWTGITLLTAALIAAFLYLFSDALGRLNDWGMALRRAAHLFFFGWAQATVFAAAASLLAADAILMPPTLAGQPLPALALGIGPLYPGFVVAGGIVSFAIGVFTQILWAGLAVTEPL